ncbi:hypothetical protein CTA2_8478 [Colletotrichum tanaceti]|uniref:Rhodopsin domain-containing protein n=1 Tax=Colletotrichum tanaceti TaxID=1306861 RepID=A0A4U6X7E1_9PEZI|nr:hypothetical protein CTA2_8478 [Colletotrichum tanaceti]TKW51411.1 hypothetical protein CTA1_4558 [Colletotrichum tanaceti]
MSDATALPTPSGATPTGSLPTDSRRTLVIGVSSAFMAIAVLFMALRVYIRGYVLRAWGLDDSMFIWASILLIGYCAVVQCDAVYGTMGSHVWTMPQANLRVEGQYLIAIVLMYQVSFAFAKATILLQYRRAFALPRIRLFCDVLSGVLLVMLSAILIYGGVILDRFTKDDKKHGFLVFSYVNAAAHIVTNVIIFILPIALVQQMRLAPMQKLGLIASFGVGIFTTAISILRIVNLNAGLNNNDVSYDIVPLALLGLAEPTSAIMCACAPLVRRLLPWPGTTTTSRCGRKGHQRPMSEIVDDSNNTGRMHLRHDLPPQSPASPMSLTKPQAARVILDVEGSVHGDMEGYRASRQARGSVNDVDPLAMHPSTPNRRRTEP